MPGELHIVGQLSHARNFGKGNLFILWEVVTGSHWEHIEGNEQGQTHVIESEDPAFGAILAHPIDVHFRTSNVQGWPKLVVHVWHQDAYGRKDFVGYGVAYLPCFTSGFCDELVEVQTWTPVAPSFMEQLRTMFLGGAAQLKDDNLVHKIENRYRLRTMPSGQVYFRLSLLTQYFDRLSVTGV
eukprot:TRINITY_DN2298_c1_g1_i1.p1 TRINITY_DN2298_c1_g1~~TRINITY_DN2298_c1_g1_i1.p1  ORF type:complete len:201 (+),score=87.14 TRINITY_DN2298_c1_g1_i1:55-603(+)